MSKIPYPSKKAKRKAEQLVRFTRRVDLERQLRRAGIIPLRGDTWPNLNKQ